MSGAGRKVEEEVSALTAAVGATELESNVGVCKWDQTKVETTFEDTNSSYQLKS